MVKYEKVLHSFLIGFVNKEEDIVVVKLKYFMFKMNKKRKKFNDHSVRIPFSIRLNLN